MSLNDTLTRINAIETEIATLTGAGKPPPTTSAAPTTSPTGATAPASFADTLAQAQTVSSAARGKLTSGQAEFASRLASQTGLDPNVIAAWLLAKYLWAACGLALGADGGRRRQVHV